MTKLARWCLAGRQTFLFSSHVFFLPYKRECSTKYLTRPGFIRGKNIFFFSSIRLYISRGQRHFWFFFPSPHSSTRFGKIAIAVGMKSAQGKGAGGIKKKRKASGWRWTGVQLAAALLLWQCDNELSAASRQEETALLWQRRAFLNIHSSGVKPFLQQNNKLGDQICQRTVGRETETVPRCLRSLCGRNCVELKTPTVNWEEIWGSVTNSVPSVPFIAHSITDTRCMEVFVKPVYWKTPFTYSTVRIKVKDQTVIHDSFKHESTNRKKNKDGTNCHCFFLFIAALININQCSSP